MEVGERRNEEVSACGAERFGGMVGDETDGDSGHAGGLGGLDAGRGVLEDDTVRRRNLQSFGGEEENLRIRLASGGVLGSDDGTEVRLNAGELQDEIEVGARGAGAYGLAEAELMQGEEKVGDAGEEVDALTGKVAVALLLEIADAVGLGRREAVAEKKLKNLGIAFAEGSGKVGAIKGATEFVTGELPGLEVEFGGVDKSAVHVPEGSVWHERFSVGQRMLWGEKEERLGGQESGGKREELRSRGREEGEESVRGREWGGRWGGDEERRKGDRRDRQPKNELAEICGCTRGWAGRTIHNNYPTHPGRPGDSLPCCESLDRRRNCVTAGRGARCSALEG